MAMFRNKTVSNMLAANFGAGSIIDTEDNSNDVWLVVCDGLEHLKLLNLKTMILSSNSVKVEDPYHITSEEASKLTDLTGRHWTLSDFTCIPKGLKDFKP